MENALFGIKDLDIYIVLGILVLFGLLEVAAGYLSRTNRSSNDWIQEVGGFFGLSVVIKPLIVFSAFQLGSFFFGSTQFALSHWSLFLALPFYLFIDDVMQYWYHRSAHEYEFLWKLHRPHHQAEEMGFFISYRNSALYYLLMPNIWWIAMVLIVPYIGMNHYINGKSSTLSLVLLNVL